MDVNYETMLPTQLEEIMQKITQALTVVKKKRNTCGKFASYEKETLSCPNCNSLFIVKNGKDKNRLQCYKCKSCGRKFNEASDTLVERAKLTYEQLEIFFKCMNNEESIRKTAAKMGVDKNTAFLLRHKVLDTLREEKNKIQLKGKVEADEYYTSINLKGTKTQNMPRFSKPRSSKGGSKRGISGHQVCVASAIDEYDQLFFEIVGTGPITSDQVKKIFLGKDENIDTLITDCKSSYEDYAKQKFLILEQVKSGTYVNNNGYNLASINQLHSELDTFLSKFRGVSTKHLSHYLDWFSFRKVLNYTVEIINQIKDTMKTIVAKTTTVNSKNVYDNSSGIDFKEVYAEYKYIPSPTN